MSQFPLPQSTRILPEVRYLRTPEPIVFPEEAEVPEGKTHLILRTFLFWLLRYALGPGHSIGSDQFVYWIASNPRRCLSPDLFVKLGVPDTSFATWKTWERGGPPDLAVEIISPNEGDGIAWEEKLAGYHELGVRELVRFDPAEPEGGRLRVWDRVQDDLVERHIIADKTPCLTLGLVWVVCPIAEEPVGLRFADDDGKLIETRDEAEVQARAAAEARIRELEEQLRRRNNGT